MHAVMMESLEEYLAGSLDPVALREIDAHLSVCQACREEFHGMQDVSRMFVALRPESCEVLAPTPTFFARVMERAGSFAPVPSFAGFFGLDLAFGRRLVFASLLILAVLGSYLVTHEAQNQVGPSPEAIFAQQNAPAFQNGQAEDNMLATLTAYEH